MKIKFPVFPPQNLPNHTERKIPWGAPRSFYFLPPFQSQNVLILFLLRPFKNNVTEKLSIFYAHPFAIPTTVTRVHIVCTK